jgi:hypothetical protein
VYGVRYLRLGIGEQFDLDLCQPFYDVVRYYYGFGYDYV